MGSRKSQQEHVRSLIKDAIMVLCQKGLETSPPFSVEATIGITLEDGDVMLMSLNERFDSLYGGSSSQVGTVLSKIISTDSADFIDDDVTPSWPNKRRLLSKGKTFHNRSKRKRGRPRKIAASVIQEEVNVKVTTAVEAKSEDNKAPNTEETIKLKAEENEDNDDSVMRNEDNAQNPEESVLETSDNINMDETLETSGSQEHVFVKGQGAEAALGGESEIPQVGPYQCTMCPQVYKYRKCLIEHQLKIHNNKVEECENLQFPCEQCEKVFNSKRSLIRHAVIHSEDRQRYPCEICGKKFSCPRHVEFHINTIHKGMYPYMCNLCGKHTTTKVSLAGHMASKHAIDRITCTKCQRAYASRASFVKHTCTERPPPCTEESTTCSVCSKKFDTPKRLIQHMAKHLDPRFQCDFCGRSFKWASSLHAHKVAAHKQAPPQVVVPTEQQQQAEMSEDEAKGLQASSPQHIIMARCESDLVGIDGAVVEGSSHAGSAVQHLVVEHLASTAVVESGPSISFDINSDRESSAHHYYAYTHPTAVSDARHITVPANWPASTSTNTTYYTEITPQQPGPPNV